MQAKLIDLKNISNKELALQYAKPGCIGLVGANTLIDNSIKKAQKRITRDGKSSAWSHAFIFSGMRADGHLWVIESDLEFHRKQIKLGVQENRAEKYFDDAMFSNFAVLDFGLDKETQDKIITEGLNLVCSNAGYSLREIFGALMSLGNKVERKKENKLAQQNSFFCSAMVQHCFSKANLNLCAEVSLKHITPEDIAGNLHSHTQYRIVR